MIYRTLYMLTCEYMIGAIKYDRNPLSRYSTCPHPTSPATGLWSMLTHWTLIAPLHIQESNQAKDSRLPEAGRDSESRNSSQSSCTGEVCWLCLHVPLAPAHTYKPNQPKPIQTKHTHNCRQRQQKLHQQPRHRKLLAKLHSCQGTLSTLTQMSVLAGGRCVSAHVMVAERRSH